MRNFTAITLGLGLLVSLPAMGKVTDGLSAEVKNLRSLCLASGHGELKGMRVSELCNKESRIRTPYKISAEEIKKTKAKKDDEDV